MPFDTTELYKTQDTPIKETPVENSKELNSGFEKHSSGNIVVRFVIGLASFIVGLSAFYFFKLILMIPLNLAITPENMPVMEGAGVLLVILAIYLAVKYTKKLNASGTRMSRNIMRTITIVLGVASALISTAILHSPYLFDR